ncbi:MAG: hypothetical protein N2485_08675, partial [bacterium]|nr:hypothetical protein [bacterium]
LLKEEGIKIKDYDYDGDFYALEHFIECDRGIFKIHEYFSTTIFIKLKSIELFAHIDEDYYNGINDFVVNYLIIRDGVMHRNNMSIAGEPNWCTISKLVNVIFEKENIKIVGYDHEGDLDGIKKNIEKNGGYFDVVYNMSIAVLIIMEEKNE